MKNPRVSASTVLCLDCEPCDPPFVLSEVKVVSSCCSGESGVKSGDGGPGAGTFSFINSAFTAPTGLEETSVRLLSTVTVSDDTLETVLTFGGRPRPLPPLDLDGLLVFVPDILGDFGPLGDFALGDLDLGRPGFPFCLPKSSCCESVSRSGADSLLKTSTESGDGWDELSFSGTPNKHRAAGERARPCGGE